VAVLLCRYLGPGQAGH